MSEDARKIVRLLAEGIDPITGEVLPDASPYNHPQVIRALFSLLEDRKTAGKTSTKPKRDLPPKHGKSWTQEDRDYVTASYRQGIPPKEMAAHLERTTGSVHSELIRQGLIVLEEQSGNTEKAGVDWR